MVTFERGFLLVPHQFQHGPTAAWAGKETPSSATPCGLLDEGYCFPVSHAVVIDDDICLPLSAKSFLAPHAADQVSVVDCS